MSRLTPSRLVAAIVVVALAASSAATVLASIPDPSGVIHACYKSTGNLRAIEDPSRCGRNETAISWNQQGPPGPQGEPGPPGEPGPAGPGGPAPATRWISRWDFARVTVGADISRLDTWVWVMNPAAPGDGAASASVTVDFRTVCGGGTSFYSTGAFVDPGRVVGPLFINVPGDPIGSSGCLEITSDVPVFVMGHVRDFDEPVAVTEEPAIDPLVFFAVPLGS